MFSGYSTPDGKMFRLLYQQDHGCKMLKFLSDYNQCYYTVCNQGNNIVVI